MFTGTLMPANISTRSWASAVISGCLYYGIAFWLYLTGLKNTPASVAGQYLNLIPLFGIAAGSVLLGEQLGARQWVGAIVLVLAVSVAFRSIPTPKEFADSAGTTPGSARRQIDPVTDRPPDSKIEAPRRQDINVSTGTPHWGGLPGMPADTQRAFTANPKSV